MVDKYDTEIDLSLRNTSHTLITELVGREKLVLDVGASTGYLAKALATYGCKVTGIELDREAARQAREHCERVVVGDVETLDLSWELGEESFDVIVFGDVLEHLRDPLGTLERIKPFLGPWGFVVASIPNVAHGSVRLALLQGKFQYRPLGLLDDTHLHFFTRESVEQLFGDAGLLISELKRTRRGIFDTEVEVDRDLVPEEALKAIHGDPEAKTYQFVLKTHSLKESGKDVEPANRSRPLSEQLTERDQVIYKQRRKLRNFGELHSLLGTRNEQLVEKEREVKELTQELARLNHQLAQLKQSQGHDS